MENIRWAIPNSWSVPALLLALFCVTVDEARAEIIYVDAASSGGAGQSWEYAYSDLQDALARANVNPGMHYQIWVAGAVYIPGDERIDSFRIEHNNVQLFGGFPSGGGSWNDRDWVANPTVLSGDINGSGTVSGNSYHVVWVNGENGSIITNETVIDGFIITAGNADGEAPHNGGGGMYCAGSGSGSECSPTLRRMVFAGNSGLYAAGLYNRGTSWGDSNPSLVNVTLVGNYATHHGGAIYNNGYNEGSSSPILTNVTISGNHASQGSAIYTSGLSNQPVPTTSRPKIRNSIIWGNSSLAIVNDSAISEFSHSLAKGCKPNGVWNSVCGTDNGGNVADADPKFVNAPDPTSAPHLMGDLRLQFDSPVIDFGSNNWNQLVDDMAGNARIVGQSIDIGAYEYPVAACPSGGVLYVDGTAIGVGDGQSWTSAFRNLQDAIAVPDSCAIHVASGEYKPTDDPTHRRASFVVWHNGMQIFGGFPPGGGNWGDRDWIDNPTILSGDINNTGTLAGNAYTVVRLFDRVGGGITGATLVDGFTITGGNADDSLNFYTGGGLVCSSSGTERECSPSLSNMLVKRNFALLGGGMIFTQAPNGTSSPTLTNVMFEDNSANNGGGLASQSFLNGAFNPLMTDVVFRNNSANFGGGIYILSGSGSSSEPILVNSVMSGNSAVQGGGIYLASSSSGTCSPSLTNVTLSENIADNGGGMLNTCSAGYPQIRNSVIWGNGENALGQNANADVSHSLIQGCNPGDNWSIECGTDGGGNPPDADPLFADAASFDFRSLPGSPNIFSGDPFYAVGIESDLGGNPRTVDGQIDLGAYQSPGFELSVSPQAQYAPLDEAYQPIIASVVARSDTGFSDPASYPLSGGHAVISYPESGATVSFSGVSDNPLTLEFGSSGLTVTPEPTAFGALGLFEIEFSVTGAELALAQMQNLDTYMLTSSVTEGLGTIDPPQQVVVQGEAGLFQLTPAAGWHVVSVTGDFCGPVDQGGGLWEVLNMNQDCHVLAEFEPGVFADRFESITSP